LNNSAILGTRLFQLIYEFGQIYDETINILQKGDLLCAVFRNSTFLLILILLVFIANQNTVLQNEISSLVSSQIKIYRTSTLNRVNLEEVVTPTSKKFDQYIINILLFELLYPLLQNQDDLSRHALNTQFLEMISNVIHFVNFNFQFQSISLGN
jgi:hypothetical protein